VDALSKARWLQVESLSCSKARFEHDLFGKPVSTFPDHALGHRDFCVSVSIAGHRTGLNLLIDASRPSSGRWLPVKPIILDHQLCDRGSSTRHSGAKEAPALVGVAPGFKSDLIFLVGQYFDRCWVATASIFTSPEINHSLV
jgi:hypothetical protein